MVPRSSPGPWTISDYKEINGLNSLEWPAQSPDLNIIENIWLHIKRELQTSKANIVNKNDLFAEIQRVWERIELEHIRELYISIPDRLKNVIDMKGHLTKY